MSAYLVPRRVAAVERTCRAVQSGVEVGSVWSAQGAVQVQLLSILDSELAAFGVSAHIAAESHISSFGAPDFSFRAFADVLKAMLRERSVRDVLMLLSDIVRQGPELSELSREHRWVRAVGEAWTSARIIWARLGDEGGVGSGHRGRSAGVDVGDGGLQKSARPPLKFAFRERTRTDQ